jgi:hypothetical protein
MSLAVFSLLVFLRKRSLEGICDDDDAENDIARTIVADNFGVTGNSESLSRKSKRSMINARNRDGFSPLVKNARMTSLLDNVRFCFFVCTEPK